MFNVSRTPGEKDGDRELWKFTETIGAERVKDIHNKGSSDPTGMFAVGGKILFAAKDPFFGRELFLSDGTAKGTYGAGQDINQKGDADGTEDANPGEFVSLGETVYFTAADSKGIGLYSLSKNLSWVDMVDGLRKAVDPGMNPHRLKVAGSTVFFVNSTQETGLELWKVGGTPPVPNALGQGRLWNDLDRDGLQDAGEPGIAGIRVDLELGNGYQFSDFTDENGDYGFDIQIPAGAVNGVIHLVTYAPPGYRFTTLGDDTNDSIDSDFYQGDPAEENVGGAIGTPLLGEGYEWGFDIDGGFVPDGP